MAVTYLGSGSDLDVYLPGGYLCWYLRMLVLYALCAIELVTSSAHAIGSAWYYRDARCLLECTSRIVARRIVVR